MHNINSEKQRRQALIFTSLAGSFLPPFMLSAYNVALPTIARELHLTALAANWTTTGYLLVSSALVLPFGRLGDLYGRRRIYFQGILWFTLFSMLLMFAPSGPWVIGLRMGQGLGVAMIFGAGTALLMAMFPPAERGWALGLNVAAVYAGLSIGPFLGGQITGAFGWRALFLPSIPIGLLTLWMIRRWIPDDRPAQIPAPFDLGGAVLYAAALFCMVPATQYVSQLSGKLLLAIGLICGVGFVLRQHRTTHPLFPLRLLLENRVFAFANLASLINYAATYAISFMLSLFLQINKGLSPQEAGTLLLVQPVIQATLSPMTGRLSDRIDPRLLASSGMTLNLIGLLFLSRLTAQAALVEVGIALAIVGLGFALFSSPNINSVMSSVSPREYGIASGVQGSVRIFGQMMSMYLTLVFFSIYLAGDKPAEADPAAFLTCFRAVFLLFAGLSVIGILASLARGKAVEAQVTN